MTEIKQKELLITYFFTNTTFTFIAGYLTNALITANNLGLNNTKTIIVGISVAISILGWGYSSYKMFNSFQEIIKERLQNCKDTVSKQDQKNHYN